VTGGAGKGATDVNIGMPKGWKENNGKPSKKTNKNK
jgi:hypothetical protein